ncbi:MAG TPA: OsmC family protein [Cyclobacteriaceae bacterium]|nr:OsmC family protein [Cyclobacteriaceae bacterium]
MNPHEYEVDIAWSNDRKGIMCSPELAGINPNAGGCIEVATPPEFPKGIPGIWSPEHLFTASVSSCLMTTFLAIADNSKLDFVSFRCKSYGKLEQVEGKFMMTEVRLVPTVVVRDAKDIERGLKVLQKAEANCLISNSVKARVTMEPVVEAETVVA